MVIDKRVLLSMEGAYAVNTIVRGGRRKLLVATEQQGDCWEIDLASTAKERIWNGAGGTMTFADTASADGSFLAVQCFFPGFDSKHAVVVRAARGAGCGWWVRNVVNLPYVHRMDAVKTDAGKFFIGCTLCSSKQFAGDWSDPGAVWVGQFDEDGCEILSLHPLLEGLIKNHGYFHDQAIDPSHAYIACENGIFRIAIPSIAEPNWKCEMLCNEPTGDVALCDIDGDGCLEMLTVQPFHGEKVSIRKLVNCKHQIIWEYEGASQTGHVAWGGTIFNKPAFIFGFRHGQAELVMVTMKDGRFVTTEIDRGQGPANICVVHGDGKEQLLVSNLTIGQAALYTLEEQGE